MKPADFSALLEGKLPPPSTDAPPEGAGNVIYEREDWKIEKLEEGQYAAFHKDRPYGDITLSEGSETGTAANGEPMAPAFLAKLSEIIRREDPPAAA